jgi:inorganic phosphate transporter, PiT family
MPSDVILLILVIGFALFFDFVNGFHDTANAIATSVATRVLSQGVAVSMAAILNVVGALTGTAVATTIGKGTIAPEVATQLLVLAALFSAISRNLITMGLKIVDLRPIDGLPPRWPQGRLSKRRVVSAFLYQPRT